MSLRGSIWQQLILVWASAALLVVTLVLLDRALAGPLKFFWLLPYPEARDNSGRVPLVLRDEAPARYRSHCSAARAARNCQSGCAPLVAPPRPDRMNHGAHRRGGYLTCVSSA